MRLSFKFPLLILGFSCLGSLALADSDKAPKKENSRQEQTSERDADKKFNQDHKAEKKEHSDRDGDKGDRGERKSVEDRLDHIFNHIDADHDGSISRKEFDAAAHEMHERMQAHASQRRPRAAGHRGHHRFGRHHRFGFHGRNGQMQGCRVHHHIHHHYHHHMHQQGPRGNHHPGQFSGHHRFPHHPGFHHEGHSGHARRFHGGGEANHEWNRHPEFQHEGFRHAFRRGMHFGHHPEFAHNFGRHEHGGWGQAHERHGFQEGMNHEHRGPHAQHFEGLGEHGNHPGHFHHDGAPGHHHPSTAKPHDPELKSDNAESRRHETRRPVQQNNEEARKPSQGESKSADKNEQKRDMPFRIERFRGARPAPQRNSDGNPGDADSRSEKNSEKDAADKNDEKSTAAPRKGQATSARLTPPTVPLPERMIAAHENPRP